MRSLVTWTYIAVLLVKSLLQLRFYMIFKQVHLQNRQDYPMAMVGMAHGQSMPSFLRWILQCFPVFFLLSCWFFVFSAWWFNTGTITGTMSPVFFWWSSGEVPPIFLDEVLCGLISKCSSQHCFDDEPLPYPQSTTISLTGSVYQIVSRKDLQFLMPTILGKPSFFVGSNRLYGFVWEWN